jgi:PIN domain nuclease of toxin-antitoxin system
VRVLLDTHAFLWWDLDDVRLSDTARAVIADRETDVAVSVASIWEVAIKAEKGRIDLPSDLDAYIEDRLRRYRWTALPIHERHAIRAAGLPMIHTDPFDRMLVAQGQLEGIPIVTADAAVTRYDVETIW